MTANLGVSVVREMFGVMIAERTTTVLIVSSGQFTGEAERFAEGKPIRLMNGEALATFLALVKSPGHGTSSTKAAEAESIVAPPVPRMEPPCPKCGSLQVVRLAKKWQNASKKFPGCSTFPRCNGTRDLQGE